MARVRALFGSGGEVFRRQAERLPLCDLTLVPPALMQNLPRLIPADYEAGAASRSRGLAFLEEPAPELQGKTPRQAAAEPPLRPALLALMKSRVRFCDEENLSTGGHEDANWMLRELGLTEILVEPPPRRVRPGQGADGGGDDAARDAGGLVPPPSLPTQPLCKEEAFRRLNEALASFPRMLQAVNYFSAMGYPLFEQLARLTEDLLTPREFQFLVPIVSTVVLCLAPRGTRPPALSFERLAAGFRQEMLNLRSWSGENGTAGLAEWLVAGSQPGLTAVAASFLSTVMEQAPPNVQPRVGARLHFLLVLWVVIDELDGALRLPAPTVETSH